MASGTVQEASWRRDRQACAGVSGRAVPPCRAATGGCCRSCFCAVLVLAMKCSSRPGGDLLRAGLADRAVVQVVIALGVAQTPSRRPHISTRPRRARRRPRCACRADPPQQRSIRDVPRIESDAESVPGWGCRGRCSLGLARLLVAVGVRHQLKSGPASAIRSARPAGHLALQDWPGALQHRRAVQPEQVSQDQRRCRCQALSSWRGPVEDEVAVACVPRTTRSGSRRIHAHVDRVGGSCSPRMLARPRPGGTRRTAACPAAWPCRSARSTCASISPVAMSWRSSSRDSIPGRATPACWSVMLRLTARARWPRVPRVCLDLWAGEPRAPTPARCVSDDDNPPLSVRS